MQTIVFDIEVYPNLFLFVGKDVDSGKITRYQLSPSTKLDRDGLRRTLESHRLVGFNSRGYDLPMIQLALLGASTYQLKVASDDIIVAGLTPYQFREKYDLPKPEWDHIDIMPVCPLSGSLKIYAGRLHAKKLQELPIDPNTEVTAEQVSDLFRYCVNDLECTELIFRELSEQIKLREKLSDEYGQDLRSLSDAQIAERVIGAEVGRLNGEYPRRPEGLEGKTYRYNIPDYVSYRLPQLNAMLELVRAARFRVGQDGAVTLPEKLANLEIRIGHGRYRMGIGGLHSSEKTVAYQADEDTLLIDRDVASYYPNIILTLGLYPQHMGPAFLDVYRSLVARRLEAKRTGDKVYADALKISVNGGFGKLGNKWSTLYSPDLLTQVTLTGQLALLMQIEMIEAIGIEVISANTDGVVIRCPKSRYSDLLQIIQRWERLTGFETEETRYRAIYARDVNNYVAIKTDGKVKTKGAYSIPDGIFRFHKNPQTQICTEAVVNLLRDGTPIKDTIYQCRDITKFVSVRKVAGGAVRQGEHVGKVIRFYYARETKGTMNYSKSGNKVPKSEGSKPLMELSAEFPKDAHFMWYVAEAQSMLIDLGYGQPSLFEGAA